MDNRGDIVYAERNSLVLDGGRGSWSEGGHPKQWLGTIVSAGQGRDGNGGGRIGIGRLVCAGA
ncbi:hypothetical protein D3C85_1683200 [compost metagenome]